MTLAAQLLEATVALSPRLSPKEKRTVNGALEKAGFGGKARFRSVGEALNVAAGVLGKAGLEWDQINSASLFSKDAGHQSIRLARKNPDDAFSPVGIQNTVFGFQWTRLDDGKGSAWPFYEVIAYLG